MYVLELAVAVVVLDTLNRLGRCLEAVARGVQKICHRPLTGLMAHLLQRRSKLAGRLERPTQRRHRIIPRIRLHQVIEIQQQRRVHVLETGTATDRYRLRLKALDAERQRLMQAHYADAVPLDLLKAEQQRIGDEMVYLQGALVVSEATSEQLERTIREAVARARNCHGAYTEAGPRVRRLINQAFFRKVWVKEDGVVAWELNEPFATLLRAHKVPEPIVVGTYETSEVERESATWGYSSDPTTLMAWWRSLILVAGCTTHVRPASSRRGSQATLTVWTTSPGSDGRGVSSALGAKIRAGGSWPTGATSAPAA